MDFTKALMMSIAHLNFKVCIMVLKLYGIGNSEIGAQIGAISVI